MFVRYCCPLLVVFMLAGCSERGDEPLASTEIRVHELGEDIKGGGNDVGTALERLGTLFEEQPSSKRYIYEYYNGLNELERVEFEQSVINERVLFLLETRDLARNAEVEFTFNGRSVGFLMGDVITFSGPLNFDSADRLRAFLSDPFRYMVVEP